ncbi:MAG: hypothetical protein M0030_03475 [Actinomycetota bacterium]|nr:hypothetical protein [Actinomycetota bacterium]
MSRTGGPGLAAAFPLSAVRLLDIPFRANQGRNTGFLLFVYPDRLLRVPAQLRPPPPRRSRAAGGSSPAGRPGDRRAPR